MLRKLTANKIYWYVFLSLPVVYFLLYGFWGYCDTDMGFIPSLSYRILNGELPGRDFIYVRPPLSPFLHTLELALLPETLEFIGGRFLFYVFVGLTIWFSIQSLRKFMDFEALGISPWLFGILAYIFTAHNFPPMPWHTLDGILFATAGFFVLTRGPQWYWTAPGLILLGMAAFAKQPFAVGALAGAALLFVLYPWRRAAAGVAVAGGAALVVLALVLWLDKQGLVVQAVMGQVTGVTTIDDLRWGAYQTYIKPIKVLLPPVVAVWAICKYLLKTRYTGIVMAALIGLGVTAWMGIQIYIAFDEKIFVGPRYGFFHALLAGGMLIAFIRFVRNDHRPAMGLLMAMGVINWATAISWGYSFPVLYCLPGLVSLVWFIGPLNRFSTPTWYYAGLASVVFVGYYIMQQYPYEDARRSELTYHLGDVFPKLSHVHSSATVYGKHAQLKALHGKYGDNFAVLPSMPLANYLTDTRAPIQIDWEHDAEMNYDFGIQATIARMDTVQPYIFVERDRMQEAYSDNRHYKCTLLKHILESPNWVKLEENTHFLVYGPNFTPGLTPVVVDP